MIKFEVTIEDDDDGVNIRIKGGHHLCTENELRCYQEIESFLTETYRKLKGELSKATKIGRG